ncbi:MULTISPECIES: hypothetical protein [unclassified Caballeronia]|uniref:hypothetical protein n=1 Tax=unclassified Caballeronia TaxID=2646786 RepID=UPI0028655530|nr:MULTISPECIES: hypothetical protein [unclassified Caballeronia]MDR5755073.1 hypothetical protein [Caballeronia sp. LZ024]MDR5841564.1 hypothetical protein [Caballeronia sp. LZ031]
MTRPESLCANSFDVVQHRCHIFIGIDEIAPQFVGGELHLRKNGAAARSARELLTIADAASKVERLIALQFRDAKPIRIVGNEERDGFGGALPETS